MAHKLYALLVGINDYLGGMPALSGCINDVKQMHEFLKLRTQEGEFEMDARLLTSEDRDNPPTRNAVIEAFGHLRQAGPDDVALFYYSGHGSQENAPPQFWHLEPDHMDETIVCYDSRVEGGWDVADKELAVLIGDVAKGGAHVVVVLDSCHSGSGTRAADGTRVRLAPVDGRDRPLDTFLPGVMPLVGTSAKANPAQPAADAASGEWLTLPEGRHVVISACRAEQSAREKLMEDGYSHGVLSYYLLDTLRQVGPNLSYRDVLSRAGALVRNAVTDQNPLMAATNSEDLDRPFLGGAILPQSPYFALEYQKNRGWVLKAGAIHGIAKPAGAETTYLSVFPLQATINIGDELSGEIGRAKVVEVAANESLVELTLEGEAKPNQKTTYKAVVIATPLPPVAAFLAGDDPAALELVRQRLKTSPIVREVEDVSAAAIVVSAMKSDTHYRMRRAGDQYPLAVAVPDKGTASAAVAAAARLEHMGRWMQLLALENKQSQIPPGAIAVEVYQYDPQANEGKGAGSPLPDATDVRLGYDPGKGEDAAYLQVHLTNRSEQRLYCMLVDLTEDFAVATDPALFGGGVWLKPGEDTWATQASGKKYIGTWIPDELRALGVSRLRDVFKLIVSTDESDAIWLKQDGLEVVMDPGMRGAETSKKALPPSTLDRLMQRVQTRAGGTPPRAARLSDWRTSQFTVTTADLSAEVDLPKAGQATELADGVWIEGHDSLEGRASLVTPGEASRDVGTLAMPAAFRSYPEMATPFDFRRSRGGDAGASALVLTDVVKREAVTPEDPLRLRLSARLEENQALLPVGYDPDSRLFLPLGTARQTASGLQVRIDRLPGPTADGRDVKGSIKLFFYKVIGEKLGMEGATTRLAVATVNKTGQVEYDDSTASVAEKVKGASRILLYVHGHMGDTRGMVASSAGLPYAVPNPPPALAGRYDLILGFDYESLTTKIEETAGKLKEHLKAVGLGAGHKKTLHVIAHSLGCVVTRQLVEREGGSKVVQKVVLAAGPNAGTPWAKIEDLALVGLGAALNGLAAIIWPPGAVPALVGLLTSAVAGVEKVDNTLDQIKPDSTFLKTLAASDDPGVPYAVIAGDITKIQAAAPAGTESKAELLKRLVERLASKKTLYRIKSLAFLGKPNDTAISVESIEAVPADRKPPVVVREITCDHSSYFTTEVGLREIADVLQ